MIDFVTGKSVHFVVVIVVNFEKEKHPYSVLKIEKWMMTEICMHMIGFPFFAHSLSVVLWSPE